MAIINFFCLFFVIFGWLVGLVLKSETASSTKKGNVSRRLSPRLKVSNLSSDFALSIYL